MDAIRRWRRHYFSLCLPARISAQHSAPCAVAADAADDAVYCLSAVPRCCARLLDVACLLRHDYVFDVARCLFYASAPDAALRALRAFALRRVADATAAVIFRHTYAMTAFHAFLFATPLRLPFMRR